MLGLDLNDYVYSLHNVLILLNDIDENLNVCFKKYLIDVSAVNLLLCILGKYHNESK